jgi:hypothetical protein
MLMLLKGYKPEDIVNFYISGKKPDQNCVFDSMQITDKQAIRSLLFLKQDQQKVKQNTLKTTSVDIPPRKRTSFSSMLRCLVWRFGHWHSCFNNWISQYHLTYIVLQCGDFPYFFDFVSSFSKKRKIPLVLYNTENYYFKRHDYFRRKLRAGLGYRLFHFRLKKSISKTIKQSILDVYLTETLLKKYKTEFPEKKAMAIYNSSSIQPNLNTVNSHCFLYAGNLANGRLEQLILFSNVLAETDKNYTVKVYGSVAPEEAEKLKQQKNIVFCGKVSYETVVSEEKECLAILAINQNTEYAKIDLVDAFSTKIPDALNSGRPLLYFGLKSSAEAEYLISNECALVAENLVEAKQAITLLTTDNPFVGQIVKKALMIASKNHNPITNGRRFRSAVENAMKSEKEKC